MTQSKIRRLSTMFQVLAIAGLVLGSLPDPAEGADVVAAAIEEINARCPESYPEVVVPVPGPGELSDKSVEELVEAARTWNPTLRAAISKELATRGDTAMPIMKKMLVSESGQDREIAAMVTRRLVSDQIRHWQRTLPEETHWRWAQGKIRKKHEGLIPLMITLCKDPNRMTREAAVGTLGELQARRPDVAKAVLGLFSDPDEYLAQNAVSILRRSIGVEGVDQETLFQAYSAGMKQPMPGGRGQIVLLIGEQDEKFQKRCAPLLLEHLKRIPKRDAMGGSLGQVEALKFLSALGEESLLEHIPFVMNKKYRHHRKYLEAAAEAAATYGPKAKPILPFLKKTLQECETELKEIEAAGINRRTKMRHQQLTNRAKVLRKAVADVEK